MTVKAPNDYSSPFHGRGGSGQLLLMRTPVLGEETETAEAPAGKSAPSK